MQQGHVLDILSLISKASEMGILRPPSGWGGNQQLMTCMHMRSQPHLELSIVLAPSETTMGAGDTAASASRTTLRAVLKSSG